MPSADPRITTGDSTARRSVHYLVLVAVFGLVAHTWLVEGALRSIVVSSGSMADALLGPHRRVTCSSCGFEFVCGLESLGTPARAVCPNCGSSDTDVEAARDLEGDRLLIDRATFELRSPRRWEIAVFRCPNEPTQQCIKRIVGLPGERIRIRDGNVLADGRIVTKTFAQQMAMASIVNDDRFRPRTGPDPSAWKTADDSGWQRTATGFTYARPTGDPVSPPASDQPVPNDGPTGFAVAQSAGWLTYEHSELLPAGERRPRPVTDDVAYNPNESRALNVVRDLIWLFRIKAHGKGNVWLQATDGRDRFVLHIHASSGRVDLARNGQPVASAQLGALPLAEAKQMAVVLADGRFALIVQGDAALEYPYQPDGGKNEQTARPFSLGADTVNLEVTDLQVWRDVHYLDAPRSPADADYRLGADEYYVLGDNSPLSEDSRQWLPEQHVDNGLLLGKPIVVSRH